MQIEFKDFVEYVSKDLGWIVQEKGTITAKVEANNSTLLKVEVDDADIFFNRISMREQSRLLTEARKLYTEIIAISPRLRD
jgi:hypothetical protein